VTTQIQDSESAALRIVRGEPSAEELAALVAVLAARAAAGAGADEVAAADLSGWTDRARYVRSARVEFGARAGWRASALPR
jgi:Acyl-CoA carboxylase epsilon subunit